MKKSNKSLSILIFIITIVVLLPLIYCFYLSTHTFKNFSKLSDNILYVSGDYATSFITPLDSLTAKNSHLLPPRYISKAKEINYTVEGTVEYPLNDKLRINSTKEAHKAICDLKHNRIYDLYIDIINDLVHVDNIYQDSANSWVSISISKMSGPAKLSAAHFIKDTLTKLSHLEKKKIQQL